MIGKAIEDCAARHTHCPFTFESIDDGVNCKSNNRSSSRNAVFEDGQWSSQPMALGGEFRSCFCVASQSVPSAWIIEGRLPNGDNVQLASYETDLFDPANPRYVTMKAMCGLPIRFVAATPQTNARLWVVFKS